MRDVAALCPFEHMRLANRIEPATWRMNERGDSRSRASRFVSLPSTAHGHDFRRCGLGPRGIL
jgi:hypothetical protein